MRDISIFENLNSVSLIDFKSKVKNGSTKESEPQKPMKPSDKMLFDMERCGFDLSQMRSILQTKGHQLVVSCAGSGKTTSLIFKILYDIRTGWATRLIEVNGNPIRVPEKIWVSTFLKSGADELESSLKRWQSTLNQVDASNAIRFSTLHAEFKRALNSMGITTIIISESDNLKLLKEVLAPYHLVNSKGKSFNSEDYRNIESALTCTRNILDNTRYVSDIYDDLGITKKLIDNILFDWKRRRIQKGVFDFEDLQETLYEECYVKNNTEVINFLASRYEFIYIDEFQDTSQIQYSLLKVYAMKCKQLLVLGDDDQTIYSWRGSDHKIITEKFKEDFDPSINYLSTNFRCPSNILNAVVPSIEKNTERFSKELKSSKEGGRIRVAPMASYSSMISMLGDCILNDVNKNKSVAILCRVNSDGLMPALILDKLNMFPFSISGDGMTLDSYIGRTAMSIVKLFTERSTASVKSALSMLTWDQYCVNNLMKVCKSNKMSIWEVDAKDLAYSSPEIATRLLKWRDWKVTLGSVKALELILQDYRVSIFDKDTQFNSVMRSVISSVEALLGYSNFDSVEEFQMELESINESLIARKKKRGVKVQIATVHEFKGKEADSVYIWNDSDEVFPQRMAVESGGLDALEEERRVHYIACTRAKEVSTLVYLKNKPGLFVGEMNLEGAEQITIDTGVMQGIIKSNSEEKGNLINFKKLADSERTEKDKKIESETYLEGLVPINLNMFENEFWGGEDGV